MTFKFSCTPTWLCGRAGRAPANVQAEQEGSNASSTSTTAAGAGAGAGITGQSRNQRTATIGASSAPNQRISFTVQWSRRLPNGKTLDLRRLGGGDFGIVDKFLQSLSDAAIDARFGRDSLSDTDKQRFISPRTTTLMAWVEGQAVGLVDRTPIPGKPGAVDVGLIIHQDHHRAGIGVALAHEMIALIKAEGYSKAEFPVLLRNRAIKSLVENKFGAQSEGPYVDDPRYLLMSIPLDYNPTADLPPVKKETRATHEQSDLRARAKL